MNYYNYFTEIEDAFVSRRGSHIHISPLDWSLIESWRRRGVPLDVVLRGIHTAFDGYDRLQRRSRKVNSLFYCQQEVEAQFERHLETQVGAGRSEKDSATAADNSQFAPATVATYLDDRRQELVQLAREYKESPRLDEVLRRAVRRLDEMIKRLRQSGAIDPEPLEAGLTEIEGWLLAGLRENLTIDDSAQLRREAEIQLKGYKQGMEAKIYEQTLENFIARRLRERFRVPRLSLFYM